MRRFVGFELAAQAARAVPEVGGAAGWRSVDRADLHVTLVFLGAAEPAPLPVRLPPAGPLVAMSVIALPRRRPHALALAFEDPTGRCAALQAAVREALGVAAGDDRPWLAHVTFTRRRGRERARPPHVPVPALSFTPTAVVLWASRSDPALGPRYTALERVRLGAGPGR